MAAEKTSVSPETSPRREKARPWLLRGAALLAVVAFGWLAGRFWHPHYGFTKFIQLDEADARSGIREVREYPVFTYDGQNGYDGAAYAQIAFHPLLDSDELQPALGNVPYRARRILGSALAWVFAGGEPARIANTYAALNLGVWLVLALVLWRVLPVSDARSGAAWAGVMFSAGALHSVRLALTDLLAATLVLGAIAWNERRRERGALGLLAAAGLARETALAGVVALWRGPWTSPNAWLRNAGRAALVVLPLLLWVAYVRWKAGPAAQGFGNFTWPIVGWVEKWISTLADFGRQPNFRWLNTTTLLALIGLTAQAAFFVRRLRRDDPWWRAGVAGVAMMAMLGTSVWEGHPGAATRVLLPMGVAFAVLAVRERAGWGWITTGSLGVFSGVLALWTVPPAARELSTGHSPEGTFAVRLEEGWYGVERHRRSSWSWSEGRGVIVVELAPRTLVPQRVRVNLRAITPREVEILFAGKVVWRGEVGERAAWVEFDATPREAGRLRLELRSATPPVRENEDPGARALGFAIYGAEVI